MGVYIPNMEMPKSCGTCFFDTRCDNWRLRNWGAPPPDDCPLVSVQPHGRLIDADALLKWARERDDGGPINWVDSLDLTIWADLHTIIPAEEGE